MKRALKKIPVQFLLLGAKDLEANDGDGAARGATQHEELPRGSGGEETCLAKKHQYSESMRRPALQRVRWTIYFHGASTIRQSRYCCRTTRPHGHLHMKRTLRLQKGQRRA